jgi:hypothetical protein
MGKAHCIKSVSDIPSGRIERIERKSRAKGYIGVGLSGILVKQFEMCKAGEQWMSKIDLSLEGEQFFQIAI